jgi:cation diffusion facilitator family transporter
MQSAAQSHNHVFLGERHEANERKTWAVIILCGVMMLVEIVGGAIFNSLALIADGLHMSTHAGAMLIAALAYTYARRHATDHRFVFGTGKLGDLAGFTSAIVLAVIALFIGYEAIERFIAPVPISFTEAIPIAIGGLLVNIASAWLLSGDHHGHSHGPGGHSHSHGGAKPSKGIADAHDNVSRGQSYTVAPADAYVPLLAQRGAHRHDHGVDHSRGHIHSHGAHGHDGHSHEHGRDHSHSHAHDERSHGHPHDHAHGESHERSAEGTPAQATIRDNSIRSAYVHVLADAFVSVLAITGLILAKLYGWLWMDPLAGIIGAVVIANWSVTLIRDTAGVLLDVCPDEITRERVRRTIENDGDQVVDLHLWRLGPGHLAAVVAIATSKPRDATFYRGRLAAFACLSHITVEVTRADIS